MSDQYVLKSSIEDNNQEFLFTKKNFVFQPDSNAGSYSNNQIIFNLDNIANTSQYINFLESYVVIPLVFSTEFSSNTNNTYLLNTTDTYKANLLASLKNSNYQLIHSLNLKLANNEVLSIVPYQNLKINYEIVSKWSQEDVSKCGSSIHFTKETGDTASFSASIGSVNNKVHGFGTIANSKLPSYSKTLLDSTTGCAGNQVNMGRIERMLQTNVAFDDPEISGFNSLANAKQHGKDCAQLVSTTAAGAAAKGVQCLNIYINAILKLSDLHDYFAQCPLMKNGYYQLVLNLNTNAVVSYNVGADGAVSNYAVSSATPTIPFQISQLSTGWNQTNNSGFVKSTMSIAKGTTAFATGNAESELKACRFYACLMSFTAENESRYLSSPVRSVKFQDVFTQQGGVLTNVDPGSSIQVPISGSFSRLRKIVIYPFLNSAANVIGYSPLQSVFASEPAICSPYSYIENLNVVVSGEYLYSQNQSLAFEQYHELLTDGSINGSLSKGLNSGLVSQTEFENSYGFVVINLSRKQSQDDNIMRNIVINFTNKSTKKMDYIVQLFIEKEISLNVSTGNLIL